MRMQVNSGVSENVESFSNFLHGREICFNQKKKYRCIKEGAQEKKLWDTIQWHLYSACCLRVAVEKKKRIVKP